MVTAIKTLLNWYDSLRSRKVDLVGDFAGSELFIIEGDSLLLHCFSDEDIHLDQRFQLLHAVYLVESVLSSLHRRRCRFHLVFFDEHERTCLPFDTQPQHENRFLLARQAMISHLQQNKGLATGQMEIVVFKNYTDKPFMDFLSLKSVYFIMCHDGTNVLDITLPPDIDKDEETPSDIDDTDSANLSDNSSPELHQGSNESLKCDSSLRSVHTNAQLAFRKMIHYFVCQNYNIALINEMEVRDTRIMVMVVEGSAHQARMFQLNRLRFDYNCVSEPENLKTEHGPLQEILERMSHLMTKDWTQRDCLLVSALGVLSKSGADTIPNIPEIHPTLLHLAALDMWSLGDRTRISDAPPNVPGPGLPFNNLVNTTLSIVKSEAWCNFIRHRPLRCNVADLVDERVYNHVRTRITPQERQKLSEGPLFESLITALKALGAMNTQGEMTTSLPSKSARKDSAASYETGVRPTRYEPHHGSILPFSNPIFDPHLKVISLDINEEVTNGLRDSSSIIFKELSHWHNHRNALAANRNPVSSPVWLKKRVDRNMHRNFTEIRDYAASLTSSSGSMLCPELISIASGREHAGSKSKLSTSKGNRMQPSAQTNRKGGSKAGKINGRDLATVEMSKRQDAAASRTMQTWKAKSAILDQIPVLSDRFEQTRQYLREQTGEKLALTGCEIRTYMLDVLFRLWVLRCKAGEREDSFHIAALIWHSACTISKLSHGITMEISSFISEMMATLRLPAIRFPVSSDRKLSVELSNIRLHSSTVLTLGMSALEFQLMHCGPYFDRDMGTAADPRVADFEPDKWQREVLDEIDARRSLFVVAPTSAGKTFISFYAMKQILKEDDDGILVYVAPTKALVNQIAAEIHGRFEKKYKYPGGRSVWAIHTRDHRINNATGCQILVTVPHVLQIMLLSPPNATSWSHRVKRIIFDEIHCIGQAEDGIIWEQLLLLAPCPIIALSATVGNPDAFCGWLQLTQRANNNELTMIRHPHRYSDLRKFMYTPPKTFAFGGFHHSEMTIPTPGLDKTLGMTYIHPITGISNRQRRMPEDLSLEPRDCFLLWKAMKKYETPEFSVPLSMSPETALPGVIGRIDVFQWESQLKSLFQAWMDSPNSPFEKVLAELNCPPDSTLSQREQISPPGAGPNRQSMDTVTVNANSLRQTTLPLVCSLFEQKALPAIFFNYDRTDCESVARYLLDRLLEAEAHYKETSIKWKHKIAGWKRYQTLRETTKRDILAKSKRLRKEDEEGDSALNRLQDLQSLEPSEYESFDPTLPIDAFSLSRTKRLTPSEFRDFEAALRYRAVPDWLIQALHRGIGVNHAGMNRKYRQVCEMLFRKGYLQVVIATGTLALGINMPCKTVVFAGDSIFLTALSFRQAAGRAGRRGFDMLGNVVFQGLPSNKVSQLLSSRLPDLNGHFPITTTLVLRLFGLLHQSRNAPYAIKAVNSILSSPCIYLGGEEARHTVLHHLRFSIEYLRRNSLLDVTGAPLNFAECVSHLYYTENASFAFHALLKDGYFHKLCGDIITAPQRVLQTLLLVLCHLFGRRPLRQSVLESHLQTFKKSSSIVVLPPLPDEAANVLHLHDEQTLKIYTAYVSTFIDQHVHDEDNILPYTRVVCGGTESIRPADGSPSPRLIRKLSNFIALSRHCDEWKSIPDLCRTVRSGVWLEEAVIPYVSVHPSGGKAPAPLNSYLLDFFKHGSAGTLEVANGIRRGDIWYVLNDFSLVLATIETSLENLLKRSPGEGVDMADVVGGGDAEELTHDFEYREDGGDDMRPGANTQTPPGIRSEQSHTSKTRGSLPGSRQTQMTEGIPESWEDVDSDALETGSGASDDGAQTTSQPQSNTLDTALDRDVASEITGCPSALLMVLQAFKLLRQDFNQKFKKMWA